MKLSSLPGVAQRLGYQPTTLYKINRAAYHTISLHTAASFERSDSLAIARRFDIALYLQVEHVALTRKHIERYLVQQTILRDPKVRQLLREVCCEVDRVVPGSKGNDE